MGTIACSRVLDRAAKTLLDETGVRWSAPELLDYLNAGLNAVVANKPDAGAVTANVTLVAGSAQSIPSGGIQLLDVIRNMGADGSTPGKAIRPIERNELDDNDPDWHTVTGAEVLHYTADKRRPKQFYVYPAASGKVIEISYVGHPATVTNAADTLPIDDLYENPLHSWIVGYAMLKASKSGDLTRATFYMQSFSAAIGAKGAAQFAYAPIDPDVAKKTGADV